ncbi:FtsJ-like methyltransferase, putative [Plasmodium vivax]|nr:FtsJ-like methyltransferase, putative [Plasmodium vivax]
MNHTFTFETNLNDIFAGDDVAKSEKSCDYCVKRKRVCRCETIRRELGSEDAAEIAELQERRRYYDEICNKIVGKYKDVVNRFEYDKDVVSFIKKNKINDEVECEDWIYFYELLKERRIVERCIDTKGGREAVTLNSFHFDEEANFISCLNYYLKVHKLHHVVHSWMGMSVNPFDEYSPGGARHAGVGHSGGVSGYGGDSDHVSGYGRDSDRVSGYARDAAAPEGKRFHPLYYYLYVQENERWISGLNNSGRIIHPENINHVWNQTVRESNNKVKLFQLITANSVSADDVTDYCKREKKNQQVEEQNSHVSKIGSISQLVCALGMVDVGGCFIMKMKLSFDNFLLSIFSILAICFKNLEVYRPSCCHLRNVVFLVGVHFNGITSIFLSSLNNWVQGAQREVVSLLGEQHTLGMLGAIDSPGVSVPGDPPGGVDPGRSFKGRSIIPRKWIKQSFFREYQKCIHHFVDYLIYYLKKCINVSNTNLMKKNIEDTKRMYLSQFFEEHRLVDLRKRDKLLSRLLDDLYFDLWRIIPPGSGESAEGGESGESGENRESRENGADKGDHLEEADGEDCRKHFPYEGAPFSKKELQKLRSSLQLPPQAATERGIFFETRGPTTNGECANRGGSLHKYRKQITALLRRIDFKGDRAPSRKRRGSRSNRVADPPRGLFQLDEDLIRKRVFSFDKALLEKHEAEFEGLLKKQAYFTNKNWFRCYLQKEACHFVSPFYLGKDLYRDIQLFRQHIYYNQCDASINSLKQVLKRYEPVCSSYVMDGSELCSSVIDCLFVLKNCAHVDLTEGCPFLQNFLVISGDASAGVFSFFSKFGSGCHVLLQGGGSSGVGGVSGGASGDVGGGAEPPEAAPPLNVQELFQRKTPYKHFSELLKDRLEGKSVCPFVLIDLNTHLFPSYVHVAEKEIKTKSYLVSSLIICFNYLKKGGNLLLHLSSALTFFTAGLLYVLVCAFDRVEFFLPPSCDGIDLGFYICCHNFGGNYVYRHYVQFLWEALICNQHLEEKVPGSATSVATTPGEANAKRKKGELYLSVPLFFLMNKHFVSLLKRFNSFYFTHHLNVCRHFLREPKYFYPNRTLVKCLVTHFFRAYVLPEGAGRSFGRVFKSVSIHCEEDGSDEDGSDALGSDQLDSDVLGSDQLDSDRLDSDNDGRGHLPVGDATGSDFSSLDVPSRGEGVDGGRRAPRGGASPPERNNKKKQKIRRNRSRSGSLSGSGSGGARVASEGSEADGSSSESNYSLAFEYKNVPSEISVSETAWGDSS